MEYIGKFIQLFQAALSNDDTIREEASREILSIQENNTLELIHGCIQIIMLDSVPQTSQLYSFVILCNIFRPTYDTSEKYQTLTDEMKFDLRSAFLRGLLFEQPEIYNQAAYLVSLIIVIDDDLQVVIEILSFLRDLLINGEHQETAHYAAITALQEIYLSKHVIDIYNKFDKSDPTFINVLIQQKNDFIEFMKNGYNYPTTFIKEIIKTLEYFIDRIDIKPVLKDIEEEINIFFEIFELMLPQVIEVDLYRSIFRLMYCLVGKFYGSPALDIERVISITTNGIVCDNPDFVVISIDFWDCVATQEIKRKKRNFINKRCQLAIKDYIGKSDYVLLDKIIKPEVSDFNYLISFASESISYVLNVLTQIDPLNQDAENQSDVETPYDIAVGLINKIFKISHEGMFNKINELYEIGVTSEDWTIQNAFLLALSSLSSEDVYEEVVELFQKSGEFIVNCALSSIDRLTNSAIFTLSVIAKDYSIYSIGLEMPQILTIMSSLLNRNVLIATRSLSLLQHIIKDNNTPVDDYFTDLKNLVLGTLERDDFVSSANLDFEYPPFVTVFQTLRLIIERCTDDSIEEIKSLLVDFILQNLYELSESFQSQEMTNSMEQCLLQTMTVIFKHFHENLKDKSGEILDLLFELIQKMNSEVTDDILRVITHIISALDYEKLYRFKPKIMDYIEFTLNSNSPSIIKNSILVIANFFDKNAILVMDILPITIDLILDCFDNQNFTPDFYPDVAKNLSFIIEAISKIENFFDAEIRDKLFDIYKSMSLLPLDFDSDNGNEFSNNVLESTLLGFSAILKFSKNDPDEKLGSRDSFLNNKTVYREIFAPISLFVELSDVFDNTFLAFLEFMNTAMAILPNRAVTRICKSVHFSWLIRGIASSNTKIIQRSKAVFDIFIRK